MCLQATHIEGLSPESGLETPIIIGDTHPSWVKMNSRDTNPRED